MRTKSLLLFFSGVLLSAFAWAQAPFKTTTVTDGAFAENTPWYTMRIGANGAILSDNNGAEYISVGSAVTEYEDADLWCFTGNDADGYTIYNKQAGPNKVLASSSQMKTLAGYGGTGGSTYPILYAVDAVPEGFISSWDFSSSTNIADVEGWYMRLHGTKYAVNNFGGIGKLAFWAEGADVGSTMVIELAETSLEIIVSEGEFTASNANKTWHATWESSIIDGFMIGTGANNMTSEGDYIRGHSGTAKSCTYTITAPEGFCVAAYSFDVVGYQGNSNETLVVDGKNYNVNATSQHIAVDGLEERVATFVQKGSNSGVVFSNFVVVLRKSTQKVESSFDVFETPSTSAIPYRIPAIATASNGHIIAVADYRHSRADIGMANNGRIDLRARISEDNGKTWGDIFSIVEGKGAASPDFMHVGFGDPCIAADRESSKVIVMSCAGNVSFPSGTRNNHQNIALFYSDDYGKTWTDPVDIAPHIYAQFDKCASGPVRAMFVGSGKISQSKYIKVGEYYRLYCAVLVKDKNGTNVNFALYSDDFGTTWKVLGGVDVVPIPSGADEPKADELPDGSVLLSSRMNGGRYYNIFSYTDAAKAEGYWGTYTTSNSSTNGVTALSNSCNGEIIVAPVTRKADNKDMFLLLQSVPFGSGRTNVGIYYKELETLADFVSPDSVAWNWDGEHQSSYLGSAYSTYCLQQDGTIGFLYEEEKYCGTGGGGYTIVYKNYSIEYLTDSAYVYNAASDPHAVVAAGIDAKIPVFSDSKYVGCPSSEGISLVSEAVEAYVASPSYENYQAVNSVLKNNKVIEIEPNGWYRLRNVSRSNATLYITPENSRFTAAISDAADADQMFSFIPTADGSETYYLYNGNYQLYLGPLTATETQPAVLATNDGAGVWSVEMRTSGRSSIVCENKTGSYAGLHLAGDTKRLVPWTTGAEASQWYIEPVDEYSVTIDEYGYAAINLPFAVTLPDGVTAYVAERAASVNGIDCVLIYSVEGSVIPAKTPVLLEAAPGTYALSVGGEGALDATNCLSGMLKAGNVSGGNIYTLSGGVFAKRAAASGILPANSAYISAENLTESLSLVKDYDTGVDAVVGDNAVNVKIYNLNGHEVKNPVRGIYVTSDGRKIFVK